MLTRRKLVPLFLFLLAVPMSAQATVEGFIDYTVPYYHPQTGDICLRSVPMLAEFGVPQHSLMRGTLAPTKVFAEAPTPRHININLVATEPAMVGSYVGDWVNEKGEYAYSMKLDVTALAESNGTSVTGRAATILAAKLFLIAMSQNMQSLSPSQWWLRVEFIGLPSQAGLPGTKLHAKTHWAYGPLSPLLAAYREELINLEGSCR